MGVMAKSERSPATSRFYSLSRTAFAACHNRQSTAFNAGQRGAGSLSSRHLQELGAPTAELTSVHDQLRSHGDRRVCDFDRGRRRTPLRATN